MTATPIVPGLWRLKIRFVNAFLLDAGNEGLILIDTGFPGSGPEILEAVRAVGKRSEDVRQIVVTHCHTDHSGSLAELKRLTGATAIMHPADAAMVREGNGLRPLTPAPGLVNALICRFLVADAPTTIEPAEVEREANDGDVLPGGLRAIHVPGHCAGQIALLWPEHGGVLIAADAAANVFGLALSPMNEDVEEGRRSLAKLAAEKFTVAVFGHGGPILAGASARFARKWPTSLTKSASSA